MRSLTEYHWYEWLLVQPVRYWFERFFSTVLDQTMRHSGRSVARRFLAEHAHLSEMEGAIIVSIAFNQPWAIELMARSTKRHLVDQILVVADNSNSKPARQEIKIICGKYGIPYIPLPFNPSSLGRKTYRNSHGFALNWVLVNLLEPLRPRVIAFIDHDLFPLAPADLSNLVRTQPFYGWIGLGNGGTREHKHARGEWRLWAGYCVFDFRKVSNYRLNFLRDRSRKLDTGGQNWERLYRHFDSRSFQFARSQKLLLADPLDGRPQEVHLIDNWIHIGTVGRKRPSQKSKSRDFYARLISAIEGGVSLEELKVSNRELEKYS